MKKNVLSKLGLLVLCFGLTAGIAGCGAKEEAPAEAPVEDAEAPAEDAEVPAEEEEAPAVDVEAPAADAEAPAAE